MALMETTRLAQTFLPENEEYVITLDGEILAEFSKKSKMEANMYFIGARDVMKALGIESDGQTEREL